MSARDVREFVPFTTRVRVCALSVGGSLYWKERKGKRASDGLFEKGYKEKEEDSQRGKRSEQRRGSFTVKLGQG